MGIEMLARQLAVAALLTVALLAVPGSLVVASADPLAYCRSDVARLCPGVEPGGGRIVGCLKEHKMEVSVGCAKAIKHIKSEMGR
jgi:hypothetical protein